MGATLTLREDLARRLESLAKTVHKSRTSLATEAIEEFLTVQEWHIQAIREGMAAVDNDDMVSHEEAIAVLKKWGSSAS